jgi:hypothetical protein
MTASLGLLRAYGFGWPMQVGAVLLVLLVLVASIHRG